MPMLDLHIRFSHSPSEVEFTHFSNLANTLGFTGLAIETPKALKLPAFHYPLTIFRRLTLSPRGATQLRFRVHKQMQQTDLLVIHGRSKPIWLAAAEIPSVHMIMLKDIEDFMVMDSRVARVMANHNKPVELCLQSLLTLKGSIRSRLMRVMNNAVKHLVRADCPLILTSGASQLCELRAPRDLEALSFLAAVPEDLAKEAMRQKPLALISQIQDARQNNQSAELGRET
jgi:RNase P/RNase MRP subunit p30